MSVVLTFVYMISNIKIIGWAKASWQVFLNYFSLNALHSTVTHLDKDEVILISLKGLVLNMDEWCRAIYTQIAWTILCRSNRRNSAQISHYDPLCPSNGLPSDGLGRGCSVFKKEPFEISRALRVSWRGPREGCHSFMEKSVGMRN